MILIDFNAIAIKAVAVNPLIAEEENNIRVIRETALDQIRTANMRLGRTFGEIVICADSTSWRYERFPFYKANRKVTKDSDPEFWKRAAGAIRQIAEELRDFSPFLVVKADGAEADDIIAYMTEQTNKKVVVYSSDRDFQQLQYRVNVHHYCPSRKDFLVCHDPEDFLLEHIIKGDTGDGIPNVLSDDDTFVNPEKRQTQVSKKRLEELKRPDPIQDFKDGKILKTLKGKLDPDQLDTNFERNYDLIDLTYKSRPSSVNDTIEHELQEAHARREGRTLNDLAVYFKEARLVNHWENVQDFRILS